MSRLLKINKNWYLLDMNVEPTEGSVVIFEELVVAYATFVNVEKQLCVINNGNNLLNVTFSEVESVIASTNSNDSKPMLNLFDIEKLILETYIFNTISNEFGVEYPDEDDSIMGYYKTNQESLKILREYFTKIKMNIFRYDEYACEYNPICENNEIKITKLKN
jgi:hypothetical protein